MNIVPRDPRKGSLIINGESSIVEDERVHIHGERLRMPKRASPWRWAIILSMFAFVIIVTLLLFKIAFFQDKQVIEKTVVEKIVQVPVSVPTPVAQAPVVVPQPAPLVVVAPQPVVRVEAQPRVDSSQKLSHLGFDVEENFSKRQEGNPSSGLNSNSRQQASQEMIVADEDQFCNFPPVVPISQFEKERNSDCYDVSETTYGSYSEFESAIRTADRSGKNCVGLINHTGRRADSGSMTFYRRHDIYGKYYLMKHPKEFLCKGADCIAVMGSMSFPTVLKVGVCPGEPVKFFITNATVFNR